uniref:Uncharacterized protein n=1 Tax=Vitis vinifera TaxID=29760 RepID=F6HW91_VITVI
MTGRKTKKRRERNRDGSSENPRTKKSHRHKPNERLQLPSMPTVGVVLHQ